MKTVAVLNNIINIVLFLLCIKLSNVFSYFCLSYYETSQQLWKIDIKQIIASGYLIISNNIYDGNMFISLYNEYFNKKW